jgi:hypothetical protein
MHQARFSIIHRCHGMLCSPVAAHWWDSRFAPRSDSRSRSPVGRLCLTYCACYYWCSLTQSHTTPTVYLLSRHRLAIAAVASRLPSSDNHLRTTLLPISSHFEVSAHTEPLRATPPQCSLRACLHKEGPVPLVRSPLPCICLR